MDFSWVDLLASFGAGLFGAAIGALPAFILTGLFVVLGTVAVFGNTSFDVINNWGFGPLFGPHTAFGGGVAAAAYAAKKKYMEDGKDIVTSLAGLDKPVVLLIGGLFGAIGYLINTGLTAVVGDYTDTIALTVVLSAVIARLVFGQNGLFSVSEEAEKRGRFTPGGEHVWVEYQQEWVQNITIGLGVSIVSAWAALAIEPVAPEAANFFGFGLAAMSLIFFQFGGKMPITHHMAIIAALGATTFNSLLVGILLGVIAGILGEVLARLFLIHGDTHIDPPANAIWVMTTVVLVGALLIN